MKPLQDTLGNLVAKIDGLMGVCVRDIETKEELGIRLEEPLPMASVCKIPILVTAYRQQDAGKLDVMERVAFTEADRCFGSGLFNAFQTGFNPTLYDLLLMMIVVSDNAATDMILERLTPEGVTNTMQELGLSNIHVNRTIRELLADYFVALDPRLVDLKFGGWDAICEQYPEIKEKGNDLNLSRETVNACASDRDTSTVRDMARLCAMIANQECASEASTDAMLTILNTQQLNTRLPRDLPAFTRFPHKTGTLGSGAVVNDAGILYLEDKPVASIAVLSRDVHNPLHETSSIMASIGRAVYESYAK